MKFVIPTVINLATLSISLKYHRKLNNLSKIDVAYYLRICPTQYEKYEDGEAYITIPMLDILASLYLVSADEILYSQVVKHNKN